MHIIRTSKKPFIQSNAAKPVYASSIIISILAILLPSTTIGKYIGLTALPLKFITFILIVPVLYCLFALLVKKFYIRKLLYHINLIK